MAGEGSGRAIPSHDAPGGHTMRGLVIGMHVTPAPGYNGPDSFTYTLSDGLSVVGGGDSALDAALKAVEDGRTKFVPENWARTSSPAGSRGSSSRRRMRTGSGPARSRRHWALARSWP